MKRTAIAMLLVSMLWFTPAHPQQYRSKLLLDPDQQFSESVTLTLQELEQQLHGLEDSYQKSSAGRQLGRYYLQKEEYGKAAEYYETALAAEGLSEVSNREMLKELATVYFLQPDYPGVIATLRRLERIAPIDDPDTLLMLAQAHYKRSDYVAVVETLDELIGLEAGLSERQLKQILALYYYSGDYPKCEAVLEWLIDRNPEDAESWRQLVSVYLKQDKHKAALDRLALARVKGVPFREQDILLLADLYAANGATHRAARTLDEALARDEVSPGSRNYRRLFELWLQSREKEKATAALAQAARLGDDTELYLYLAQLQMEQEQWREMEGTMLAACGDILEDRFVSRANLYLGVSQLKLGDREAARQSLINATLIGYNPKAVEWLDYMNAAPATIKELRKISGPCRPADTKVRYDAALASRGRAKRTGPAQTPAERPAGEKSAAEPVTVAVKTVDGARFYYSPQELSLAELEENLLPLTARLAMVVVRGGGTIDGPPHMIFEEPAADLTDKINFKLAFPVRGVPRSKGKYRSLRARPFKCAYVGYQGPRQGLGEAWRKHVEAALAEGYELTGETRVVLSEPDAEAPDALNVELQTGIR